MDSAGKPIEPEPSSTATSTSFLDRFARSYQLIYIYLFTRKLYATPHAPYDVLYATPHAPYDVLCSCASDAERGVPSDVVPDSHLLTWAQFTGPI